MDQAAADTSVGRFELRLDAESGLYVAGQPIDVTASLTLLGFNDDLVAGSGSRLEQLRYYQVDGDLEMTGHVVTAMCSSWLLGRGDPVEITGHSSRGVPLIDDDDPNGDFYRQWMDGDELWLPAGTWRIVAGSDFWLGRSCDGEHVSLEAEVWITVVGEDQEPAPEPVALRTAPPNPSGGCRLAAGGGYLAPHPDTGVGVGDANGDNVRPIIWPNGFTVWLDDTGVVLLWPDGRELAREGDEVHFAGGVGVDGIFHACFLGGAPAP
jgi:hypothetical protein